MNDKKIVSKKNSDYFFTEVYSEQHINSSFNRRDSQQAVCQQSC